MAEAVDSLPIDMSEPVALALAADLGVALSAFAKADNPQLFRGWADRVALAASQRARGRLTPADLDECDRHLGLPRSRVTPAEPRWGRERRAEAGCSGSSDELLRTIEDGIAAATGDRAP